MKKFLLISTMSYTIKAASMAHGDCFFAQNKNMNTIKRSVSEASKSNLNHWKHDESEREAAAITAPLCDIVPLYGCERLKSQVVAAANTRGRLQGTLGPEVYRRRSSSNQLQTSTSQSTYYTSPQSFIVPGGNNSVNNFKIDRKSYVDLHYARIGYPYVKGGRMVKGKEVMDSVRGVCGSEESRSNDSLLITSEEGDLFEDAQSCLSDTTSFYENFMEKEITLNASVDDLADLKSISQVSMRKIPSSRNCGKKTRSIISVPLLGSLGPDPSANKDKMDNLKKQQTYGQKASEQNRIKIMEKKILFGLKSEMKKSFNVDKEYLNKYIEVFK